MVRFAQTFVCPNYRARCPHEAVEKPDRMMARVCHEVDRVFEPEHRGGRPRIAADTSGYLHDLTGRVVKLRWDEAQAAIRRGGGGHLFVTEAGDAFYAESEGFPPPQTYGGGPSR